ncbi:MAG: hypothetical protein GY774_12600 [Planctomycetes bacterium]|nr:hypothetical protein [Planctomycetota bacterium]
MWYTAIGAVSLQAEKVDVMTDLAQCLALLGWGVRTGGRGEVDDVFHKAARECGGIVKTIVPFAHYRGYDAKRFKDTTVSFDDLDEITKGRAEAASIGLSGAGKINYHLQRNLLASSAPILLGENMDEPSRFVITWQENNNFAELPFVDDGIPGSYASKAGHQEGAVFTLAKSREIPVFNLATPEHFDRISKFVEQTRNNVINA